MSGTELVLLVLLGTAVFLDEWPAVQTMVSRPIVVGVLVGLILGSPSEGAFWGAVFEAVHLGFLPVGAARAPSAGLAALAGTVVGVSGGAVGVAPAGLAVAAAIVGGQIGEVTDRLQRRWNGRTATRVQSAVEAGDPDAPGRGVAAALARAAVMGGLRTGVAVAVAVGALRFFGESAWAGWLEPGPVRLAAVAAATLAGMSLFVPRTRGPLAVWGAGAAVGAGLAWLGTS